MTPRSIDHPAGLPKAQLLDQCETRTGKVGGPGGQHRNKVETACFLTHLPSGVRAQASERRSLAENRQVALHRLRIALAVHVRSESPQQPPRDTPVPASELWQSRCVGGRIRCAADHDDFPLLLAEALDAWHRFSGDALHAAASLQVTATQLARFTARERLAWASVQELRKQHRLAPLRV